MDDRAAGMDPEAPSDASAVAAAQASEMREALRQVVDPELGMDIVSLGLIRDITIGEGGTEITMILTTPFCPYGGQLIQQVVDVARSLAPGEVRVTIGDEAWSPAMMEGADLADWGLV